MNSKVTVNQETLLKEARDFCNSEIRPFVGDFEKNAGIPDELIRKMGEKGYLAAPWPKEYGGLELDPVTYGLFTEEIGKGCSSTRAILTVHTSLVGETLVRWGNEDQKARWLKPMARGEKLACFCLTEPNVGTDAKGVETTYEMQDGKYIINGRKKWITLSGKADLFLVIAGNGEKRSAFMLEKDFAGITVKPMEGLLAGKAAYISELEFDNVEVPAENIIGKPGGGFAYITNTALDFGRYSIAWGGVAIAQAALEEMVTYARTRKQFGKKLYDFQLVRGMIADAATEIAAARALCLQAGSMRSDEEEDSVIQTTIAKHYSSGAAMNAARNAVQVFGGNGCYDKYPVERLYREAKILEIIEGTAQIQQEIISRFALKRFYDPALIIE